MNWLPLILLFGGCLATPIQQGSQINADGSYSFFFDNNQPEGRQFRDEVRNPDGAVVGKYGYQDPSGSLQIVRYNTGKDGLITQNEGSQQPIIWNGEQPMMVEPAPLTYGAVKGGSILTENDQQRHINVDEELEVREDVSGEDGQLESEPKNDMVLKDDSDTRQNDQVSVQSQTAALLGSHIIPVKGGVNPVVRENDQTFPFVVSGQRRLVEPQQQQQQLQYSLKGRSLPSIPKQIVYQEAPQGIPLTLQHYKTVSQVRRPVVQYELHPVQQDANIELLRRPTVQYQTGVKGEQRQYQYVVHKQPQTVQTLGLGQQGVKQQVKSTVSEVRPVSVLMGVQEVHKTSPLVQREGVKSTAQQTHKVLIDENSRQVPVIGGQRIIGYQLVGSQPELRKQFSMVSEPQLSAQQIISPQGVQYKQQGVQYVPYIIQQIPTQDQISNYQLVQQAPLQYNYNQQEGNQMIQDVGQLSINGYPIQYSDSNYAEQPLQNLMVNLPQKQQQVESQGIQGVQQIQVNGDRVVARDQVPQIKPLLVNQRSHIVGVKSPINV